MFSHWNIGMIMDENIVFGLWMQYIVKNKLLNKFRISILGYFEVLLLLLLMDYYSLLQTCRLKGLVGSGIGVNGVSHC